MREWVWNLFLVIAALSFIEIVMPEGGMRSYLKFIFSLIILGVIVYPISDAKGYDISAYAPVSRQGQSLSETAGAALIDRITSVQTKQIEEIYEEKKKREDSADKAGEIQGISIPARDIYSNDEEEPN